jgi:hypothetical protein
MNMDRNYNPAERETDTWIELRCEQKKRKKGRKNTVYVAAMTDERHYVKEVASM